MIRSLLQEFFETFWVKVNLSQYLSQNPVKHGFGVDRHTRGSSVRMFESCVAPCLPVNDKPYFLERPNERYRGDVSGCFGHAKEKL